MNEAAVRELSEDPRPVGAATHGSLDVTDTESVDSAIASATAAQGRVDALVNCVGITGRTGLNSHEVPIPDFDSVLTVNLRGGFLLSRAVLPGMVERRYGRILHVASIAGKEGNAGMVSYSSSKAGLIGTVKAQGKEYATTGVTINALAPAVIQTPLVDAMPAAQVKYMTHKIPMNRLARWLKSPRWSPSRSHPPPRSSPVSPGTSPAAERRTRSDPSQQAGIEMIMGDQVRIGILGAAGEAAEGHIRGFQSTSRAVVTTVADVNRAKLQRRARLLGIENVAATAEELVNADNVDAVVVATPDHLHAQHASMALAAGKHVLCEKPTSTTRADAARLVELVRAHDRVFLGGHVYHFRPDYRLLAEAYRRGDIGTAWLVEGDYVSNLASMYGATGRTPWRSDPTHPQDILLGGGCHPLGLMRWVLQDEVVEVSAYSNHLAEPRLPLDDCYVAILRFSGGAIGRLTAAAGSRGHVPDGGHVKLRGTAGSLWSGCLYRDDTEHHSPYPIRDFGHETRHIGPRVRDTRQVHYWAEQAEHFLDCVEGKSQPMTSVIDSARVVAALTACVESARTHRTIAVDNDF